MDLSLASVEELFTEIERRFPTVVVAYEALEKVEHQNRIARFRYSGSFSGALGLIEQMKYVLLTKNANKNAP